MRRYNSIENGNIIEPLLSNEDRNEKQCSWWDSAWFCPALRWVLLINGIILTLWNEANVVFTAQSLQDAMSSAVSLDNINFISKENDGMLVYLNGPLDVGEPLTDPEYGIAVLAVKLKRRVQMYQWIEIQTVSEIRDGNKIYPETTYEYVTEWRDKLVDSTDFVRRDGHQNPKTFPIKSNVAVSDVVRIGAFTLCNEIKDMFMSFILVTSDERPERRDIKLHAGLYYHSQDVWNPEVGDTRVQFSYAGIAGDIVSIIAKQDGNELHPYNTKSGRHILALSEGRVSVSTLLASEHFRNTWFTRFVRLPGFVLIYLGSSAITQLVESLGQKWVMKKKLVDYGSFHLCISLCIWLSLIATLWFWYRPWLSCLLAIAAFFPFTYSLYMCQKMKSKNHHHNL